MKKFTITLLALLAIVMQSSAATYELWVKGTQVTDANKDNVLGDGKVSYNSTTNTLTLYSVTITTASEECIKSYIDNLTIVFSGTNKLTNTGTYSLLYSDTYGSLTLTGSGSVSMIGKYGLSHHGTVLKIEGGLQLTVETSVGSAITTAEIDGSADLEFSGKETKVRAFSPRYPFANFYCNEEYQGVKLNDGLDITEPEGAYFGEYYVYDKNGNSVQNQWVTIEYVEHPIEAYAVYSNNTLTFYYDNQKKSRLGTKYHVPSSTSGWEDTEWFFDGKSSLVNKVIFDASYADYRPVSTAGYFYAMENLSSITGLENLNTSEVKNMHGMFMGMNCTTVPDLSKFNTSNVTDMGNMFNSCGLSEIDVTSFDTRKVTNMTGMFTGINVYELDLSSFNTSNVTKMAMMFQNSKNLTTIYVDDTWTTDKVGSDWDMFKGCTNLKGERGTTYDANHTDKSYAHVDGGTSNPGYFTKNHLYPLWVMGKQVSDRNYQKVVWNDQMAATEYLTHCYAKFDCDHVLHLHRIGNHSITGKGNHIIANGDIERGIPGIDGLVVVIDGGYMALTSEDDAIVVNANTTIMGLQNGYAETVISSTNEFSHAIHIGENITLNLTDFAKAKLYAPRFTIYGEPNSILNVSYSDVMVEPTSKNRERCSIAGMKELNFDGSYFCEDVDNTEPDGGYNFTTQDWYYLDEDGTKHQFSGYIRWENFQFIGAIRLGRKDLGTKSIFIRNGLSWTEKVDDMGFNYTTLLAVISSREGWTNLFDRPVLEEKYQDGSYYYYRCSDNKLMFYTQGGAYHLTPDAEPLTMDLTSMNANYTHDLTTENELNTWIPFLRYSTLYIGMGNPTEIETAPVVDNANQTQPVYNLSGQRVGKAYKGIAIQNGRKVVMK